MSAQDDTARRCPPSWHGANNAANPVLAQQSVDEQQQQEHRQLSSLQAALDAKERELLGSRDAGQQDGVQRLRWECLHAERQALASRWGLLLARQQGASGQAAVAALHGAHVDAQGIWIAARQLQLVTRL